jgi:hypothetical protein
VRPTQPDHRHPLQFLGIPFDQTIDKRSRSYSDGLDGSPVLTKSASTAFWIPSVTSGVVCALWEAASLRLSVHSILIDLRVGTTNIDADAKGLVCDCHDYASQFSWKVPQMCGMRKTMKAYLASRYRCLQALAFPHRPRCPIVGEACLRLWLFPTSRSSDLACSGRGEQLDKWAGGEVERWRIEPVGRWAGGRQVTDNNSDGLVRNGGGSATTAPRAKRNVIATLSFLIGRFGKSGRDPRRNSSIGVPNSDGTALNPAAVSSLRRLGTIRIKTRRGKSGCFVGRPRGPCESK